MHGDQRVLGVPEHRGVLVGGLCDQGDQVEVRHLPTHLRLPLRRHFVGTPRGLLRQQLLGCQGGEDIPDPSRGWQGEGVEQLGDVARGEGAVLRPPRGQFAQDQRLQLQVESLKAEGDGVAVGLAHDSAPRVFRYSSPASVMRSVLSVVDRFR